jgi:hypothetical protein
MAKTAVLAFTDPQALAEQCDEYFDSLWQERTIRQRGADGQMVEWTEQYMRPPTMAGLALHLNVTRQTLLNYGQGKGNRDDLFVPVIARAKMRIAQYAEEALYTREASTGAQFALRVNHGYGAEGQAGSGDAFEVKIIPPAATKEQLAIPKWEPAQAGDDSEDV